MHVSPGRTGFSRPGLPDRLTSVWIRAFSRIEVPCPGREGSEMLPGPLQHHQLTVEIHQVSLEQLDDVIAGRLTPVAQPQDR